VINRVELLIEDSGVGEASDIEFLCEKILVFQTACATNDSLMAKSTLAEMEQKIWPSEIKEKLNGLSQHLFLEEYSEAVELAEQTIRMIL
jgi:hypothetical protein